MRGQLRIHSNDQSKRGHLRAIDQSKQGHDHDPKSCQSKRDALPTCQVERQARPTFPIERDYIHHHVERD